jgi:hypothetical protein
MANVAAISALLPPVPAVYFPLFGGGFDRYGLLCRVSEVEQPAIFG